MITISKDAAKTIERTIESVISQKWGDLEYLIIDGSSEDGTLEIIDRYREHFSHLCSEPDTGISDALNKGISRSTGDLYLCINADDQLVDGALQQAVRDWEEAGRPDILCGAVRYLDPESGVSFQEYPGLDSLHRYMTVFHPSMVVTRQAYERVGLYRTDYRLAMDSEWFHRAVRVGLEIKTSHNVYAIMSLQGVSDRRFQDALREYRRSLKENGLYRYSTELYYWQQIIFKSLMKMQWFKGLKYRLDALAGKKELRKP